MGHVHGTYAWDMCMGHVHGTCAWDTCMGHVHWMMRRDGIAIIRRTQCGRKQTLV